MCSVKFCKVHKHALALEFSLSKVAGKAVAQRCFKKKISQCLSRSPFFHGLLPLPEPATLLKKVIHAGIFM